VGKNDPSSAPRECPSKEEIAECAKLINDLSHLSRRGDNLVKAWNIIEPYTIAGNGNGSLQSMRAFNRMLVKHCDPDNYQLFMAFCLGTTYGQGITASWIRRKIFGGESL